MIDSSVLLSKTKDKAATVGPQIKVKSSESKVPVGACRNTPSFVEPLLKSTCTNQNNFKFDYESIYRMENIVHVILWNAVYCSRVPIVPLAKLKECCTTAKSLQTIIQN